MNESQTFPPGTKVYYRNADSEERTALDGSVVGVDVGEADEDQMVFSQLAIDGTMTYTSTMDPEAHAALMEKLNAPADTTALRKHDAKDRSQPPRKPIVSRHVAGRNDRCPCGSGRKYKKCHLGRSLAQLVTKGEA